VSHVHKMALGRHRVVSMTVVSAWSWWTETGPLSSSGSGTDTAEPCVTYMGPIEGLYRFSNTGFRVNDVMKLSE
jgi:hypothetical protein